ncbi:MAG: GGDEF domain-containing protein [Rhodocyclaceae bacterium]|nr:GGDEF domain-containing protein [Rhodocyclaceae bacterium]
MKSITQTELRVALILSNTVPTPSMVASSAVQTLTYLVAIVLLPVFAIGFLIMTRERIEEANRLLATQDQLTGLANRRSLVTRLEQEWARAQRTGQPLAVVMIDVDDFKRYNDHYGHQAGDDCLRAVARVVDTGVQRATDMSARYGGEEFLLILPDTGTMAAQGVAERVRQALASLALPHAGSHFGHVTVSLGVAATGAYDYPDAQALLRAADDALYLAKQAGRDQVRLAGGLRGIDDPALVEGT